MTRVLLTLVYPLLMVTRLVHRATGRDPLRRRRPSEASLWIERGSAGNDASYFSETSPAESHHSASLPASLLTWIACFQASPRSQPGEKFSAAADREQGIPDEMYTLW